MRSQNTLDSFQALWTVWKQLFFELLSPPPQTSERMGSEWPLHQLWPLPLPPLRRVCSERRLNRAHPSILPAGCWSRSEHVLDTFPGQEGRFPSTHLRALWARCPHSRGTCASFWLRRLSPARSNAKLRSTELAILLQTIYLYGFTKEPQDGRLSYVNPNACPDQIHVQKWLGYL